MSRLRVLVVEDDRLVTGAMRILFEGSGHQVAVAHTIEEAIAAGTAVAPDVMLLDLGLDGRDGLAVLRALDAAGARPRATLVLTGRDDPDTVARCREAGCADVLVKPVPIRELVARVEAAGTAA